MSYKDRYQEAIEWHFKKQVMEVRQRPERLSVTVYFYDGTVMDIHLDGVQHLAYRMERERSSRASAHEYEYQQRVMGRYMGIDVAAAPDYSVAMAYGMRAYERPRPKCTSCGKQGNHSLDNHGWCESVASKFWGKVRRLYWHRYAKEKLV